MGNGTLPDDSGLYIITIIIKTMRGKKHNALIVYCFNVIIVYCETVTNEYQK